MKKYFHILIMAILGVVSANAAVADLQNGYYRVANHVSQRYIQVMDNKGELMYSAGDADMRAIVLVKGLEKVISDPATVLYIEKHGDKFDIQAQSTGIYQMISTYVNLMDSRTAEGSYWAYGSKSGVTMYLYDAFTNVNRETSFLATKGDNKMRDWDIYPIDNESDNYFGVAPRVKSGDKYYEPFFADFPFSLTEGMKAYYITKVDEKNGYVVYKEITGTIPRSTPVIIECSSDQPIDNKLNIGGDASAISGNQAVGVYFEFELNKHDNYVTYDKTKMRSLGVMSNGQLGAVTGDYKFVPRNTFYIPVSSSAPAQMRFVSEQEYANLAEPVLPTGITLSSTSLTLTVGQSQTLTATVSPADTTDPTVTWTSSNSSIATVDASGKVSAVNVGTATITAKCGNVSATCQVTVKPIEATSVTLSQTSISMNVGETQTLTATVAPDNASDKTIVWTSSNNSIATVSGGVVTGVAPGTATITAKCGNVSATCQVTVNAIPVTSVTLNYTTLDMNVGDTQTLTATVAPSNATYNTPEWSSSNPSVANVNQQGKVTAVSAGTATITAKCGDVSATCQVTVKIVEVTSVTLNYTTLDMNVGDTQTLTATVGPANATDKTVVWTSSNSDVVSVNNQGQLTAITAGTATITAKSGNVSATCQVTVKNVEAASVTLNRTSVELRIGQTTTLIATVAPSNTTDKTVTWSSSDETIAKVDQNGKVTAVAVGNATITATCGSASATCQVTVNPIEVSGITLDKTELTLTEGETATLTATVSPANATDKTVVWSSTDETVATVNADGVVTAVSAGEAEIRATAAAGAPYAACKVTVKAAYVPVESIEISDESVELKVGEHKYLTAKVYPENATEKRVTWSSSDPAVVTVNSVGRIVAVSVGTATVTASCGEVSASCAVVVVPTEASAVLLDCTELNLLIGETATIRATVVPEDATNPTIVWASDNESVATVDENGLVTALAEGKAVITATCGAAVGACDVIVSPIVAEAVVLDATSLEITLGETAQLNATVSPSNVTYPTVVWTSSDENVVTVDQTGLVTAMGVGQATVQARCGDAVAECAVTVLPIFASEVVLDQTEAEVEVGKILTLIATVLPADTTDPTVVWSTSDETVATVDDFGNVIGIAEGTAVITATCGEASASCVVKVIKEEGGIDGVIIDGASEYDIYTIQGIKVRSGATDLQGLPRGFYIIGNQKVYVK